MKFTMKRRLFKGFLLVLCVTLCLPLMLVSCKKDPPDQPDGATETSAPSTEAPGTVIEYPFPDADEYSGEMFRILNADNWFDLKNSFFAKSDSQDEVDLEIYRRNQWIYDNYGVTVDETTVNIHTLNTELGNLYTAGDDMYEIVMQKGESIGTLIISGYIQDMSAMDGFYFDWEHWSQEVMEVATLGESKKIYFAAGNSTLMPFELGMIVAFNKTVLNSLGIDLPYQKVKDGVWTVAEMQAIIIESKSLNGDSEWTYSQTGRSRYGFSSFLPCATALRIGADLNYCVTSEKTGNITFTASTSETFDTGIRQLQQLFAQDGNFIYANSPGVCEYGTLFNEGRATMIITELNSMRKKSATVDFGIVPMPKLNKDQKNYYTNMTTYALFATVPATCRNTSFASTFMDLITYKSDKVLEVYFEQKLTDQGAPDRDSMEMMEYIKNGLTLDYTVCFGWTDELNGKMASIIIDHLATDLTSALGEYKYSIQQEIMDMLNAVDGKK